MFLFAQNQLFEFLLDKLLAALRGDIFDCKDILQMFPDSQLVVKCIHLRALTHMLSDFRYVWQIDFHIFDFDGSACGLDLWKHDFE